MEKFSTWFIAFIEKLFKHFIEFFGGFFQLLYRVFVDNLMMYFNDYYEASQTFTLIDWILSFIAILLMVLLVTGFGIIVFQLFRKYVRFLKNQYEKEALIEEIDSLKYQVNYLLDEKHAMMSLSQENFDTTVEAEVQGRFTRLKLIDEKYQYKPLIVPALKEPISLSELVDRFINFSASQLNLYYTRKVVSVFFAGMASSQTLVLEGISGTGKTSLPYAMGKFFKNDASIISVQPSWRDRSEMMGFLNEFTKKFNETDFLESLYEASFRNDVDIIVLDEMNLARVEYYFADFLSILEMPNPEEWVLGIVPNEVENDPIHLKKGKLKIPRNVWFVGTANRDDSTYAITDKVYDRVASIEMNEKSTPIDAPYTEGIRMPYEALKRLFKDALTTNQVNEDLLYRLETLDQFIVDNFQIAFGNRITKQIQNFIPVYVACGMDQVDGLDYLIARKVIRKFESLNLPFLKRELEELIDMLNQLFGEDGFKYSKKMIQDFLKRV